jgi:hypothetical protein
MNIDTNDRVERFIQDALFIDEEQGKILVSLRKTILKISPDAQEEIKYGGLVFNVDTKLICGIFLRKEHISLEFSLGMMISDPGEYLEGNGKYRRHLKISDRKDIKGKKVESYVSKAFKLEY